MQPHKIVSRDEWLAARKAHLADEKAFTRARDALTRQRRELPWVKVEKNYVFDGPHGKETLADLFGGKSQLIVYHFMLGPGWEAGCPSCSYLADHFDGAAIHLSGTYQPVAIGTDELELNLKLTGQSLAIDELQHLMTAAGVRLPNGAVLKGGMLALNLVIIGQAKSLLISGPIALDNTRLVGFDLGSKIHGIAALSALKTGDTTNIEKLRVNVCITNASVVADKIDAVIPSVGELTGSGTVSSGEADT